MVGLFALETYATTIRINSEADLSRYPEFYTNCHYEQELENFQCPSGSLIPDAYSTGFWAPSCTSTRCTLNYNYTIANGFARGNKYSFKVFIPNGHRFEVWMREEYYLTLIKTILGEGRWVEIKDQFFPDFIEDVTIEFVFPRNYNTNVVQMLDKLTMKINDGNEEVETTETPGEPTTERPVQPGDPCDPTNCGISNTCKSYWWCERDHSNPHNGRIVRQNCETDKYFNPDLPETGVCSFWEELSNYLKETYSDDPVCI